jgi:hypothetical protein
MPPADIPAGGVCALAAPAINNEAAAIALAIYNLFILVKRFNTTRPSLIDTLWKTFLVATSLFIRW